MAGLPENPEGAEVDLDERIKEERAQAVKEAMENLSAKLLGVSDLQVTLAEGEVHLNLDSEASSEEVVREKIPEAPKKVEDEGAEEAWIESALCTACDECTGINPRIFEYNNQKQAVLKDPTAGPYADLVKAAEKCSAGIIHPGQPLNPKEKNLAKWIKRAKKLEES